MAIVSFADRATEVLWYEGKVGKGVAWALCRQVALRKLTMLDGARRLRDLASTPANHLEALKGDWAGFHSIRMNDQWRVVFRWTDNGPSEGRIVAYH